MTTEKKAAPKAPAAKATDPMTRELAAVKAMKAAAPKAAPAKAGEVGKCRGRWSKCGGTEPALSAKWHLGAKCTAEYRAMKKAEKAAKAEGREEGRRVQAAGSSPATAGRKRAPKSTPEERIARTVHRSTPPAPPKVPVARVNVPANFAPAVQLVAPSS